MGMYIGKMGRNESWEWERDFREVGLGVRLECRNGWG